MKNRLQLWLTCAALLTFAATARAQIAAETIGFTTRDRQMYGPAVRFIAFDSLSGTHAVWKDGYGSIRYNFRPRSGGWRWPGGMIVNPEPRTLGSMDINVTRGSVTISADHLYRDTHVLTRLVDRGAGTGDFYEERASVSCRYTLIGTNRFGTSKFAALSNDSLIFLSLVSEFPFLIGHVGAFPAFNVAVSRQVGWYGYIWAETEGPDRGTLFLEETPNNGANWFAASRLSDAVPSPLSRSAFSGCGTYDSASIHLLADLYDGSDVLHSQIWHYSKLGPSWRLVHEYTCPSGARLGDDALAADRPSIGMNRTRDELYAVWEQFDPDNVDPATGLCRADIWAARTVNGDHDWGPALRITRPDGASKRFPFLSEIANDTLHIIYFADQIAGFSELGQGPQTTNAVVYLRVPVDLLPAAVAENDPPQMRPTGLTACPNPFAATTTIRLSGSFFVPRPSPLALRVFDATGSLVHSSLAPVAPVGQCEIRTSSFRLDLRSMPVGVYFVAAGTGPDAASCRIVKAARAD